jgi:hypothetical protein
MTNKKGRTERHDPQQDNFRHSTGNELAALLASEALDGVFFLPVVPS